MVVMALKIAGAHAARQPHVIYHIPLALLGSRVRNPSQAPVAQGEEDGQERFAFVGQVVRPSVSTGALPIIPASIRRFKRSLRMFVGTFSGPVAKSLKLFLPSARSRMTSNVHLSPNRSSPQAMGQGDRRFVP